MTEQNLAISGMNCQHCVMALRRELERISGVVVRDVRVGSATISVDPDTVATEQILQAIRNAGFSLIR